VLARDCTVWVAAVPPRTDHLVSLIDDVERTRRARLRNVADRDRFTSAAALVRLLAGQAAGRPPDTVRIDRTCPECGQPHGRPRLVDEPGLDISVSHAGRFVAVATSARGQVGVDVEVVPGEWRDLAAVACTPSERVLVEDARGFAITWVRKEAVLKAFGHGLRVAPAEVQVSAPNSAPELLRYRGAVAPACTLVDVDIVADDQAHVAAVAVLGHPTATIDVRDGSAHLVSPTAVPRRS